MLLPTALALAACGQDNRYAAPPPQKVAVATPVEQKVSQLFRIDRQHGGDQHGRSRGPRAGLRAGDQLQRRRLRQEGHLAVHHRTGTVPAQGRSREGRGHERTGDAEQNGGRVRAPSRSRAAASLRPGHLRKALAHAIRRKPICSRRRPTTARRDQSRLHRMSRRRSTASFPRATSRSGNWSAQLGHRLSTIVQIDPIYVNFKASERDVLQVELLCAPGQKPTPTCSARRSRSGCKPNRAIRTRASSTTSRRPSMRRPEHWRRAPSSIMSTTSLLPGYFARVRIPSSRSRRCWCPTLRSAAIKAAAMCWSSTKTMSSSSARSTGQLDRRVARHRSGLNRDDRVVIGGIMRAIPGQKVEPDAANGSRPIDSLGPAKRRHRRDCRLERMRMISKFFIERPVLANVIAMLMI